MAFILTNGVELSLQIYSKLGVSENFEKKVEKESGTQKLEEDMKYLHTKMFYLFKDVWNSFHLHWRIDYTYLFHSYMSTYNLQFFRSG